MRCRNAQRLLSLRIDGLLPERQEPELASHVAGCQACRLAAEGLERAWRDLASAEKPSSAPDDWSRIEAAIDRRSWRWLRPEWSLGFAPTRAAAAVMLVAMAAAGGAGGALLGRALHADRATAPDPMAVAETLGDLPWSSPAAGLETVLLVGSVEERQP